MSLEGLPGIRCKGLTRSYGSVTALAGVDLDVDRGEIVALLGLNGAGKSTLLRILGTLLSPDDGSAEICGVDVVADPAAARKLIGVMIGDERSLYWRLSGRANLLFYAALHGMRRDRARAQAAALLEQVDLVEASDRPVRNYSSGMRARLSLARALLGDPAVLLLDEPTRSLDPVAAGEFRERTTRLARDQRRGILLATHDLGEAAAVADRIVVLARGDVVLQEATGELDANELERRFREAVGTVADEGGGG